MKSSRYWHTGCGDEGDEVNREIPHQYYSTKRVEVQQKIETVFHGRRA